MLRNMHAMELMELELGTAKPSPQSTKKAPGTQEGSSELWCVPGQEGGNQARSWSKVASAPGFSALSCLRVRKEVKGWDSALLHSWGG